MPSKGRGEDGRSPPPPANSAIRSAFHGCTSVETESPSSRTARAVTNLMSMDLVPFRPASRRPAVGCEPSL